MFPANRKLPFRDHDETETTSNKWNSVETSDLLKVRDAVLAIRFETVRFSKWTSSDIQNDLITVNREVVNKPVFKKMK